MDGRFLRACVACAAWSISLVALAADRLVPAVYPTIQAAIDASVAGDTVLIAPGAYNERLDTKGKAITVKGQFGYAQTIVDPVGTGGVLLSAQTGETTSTVIEGITFRNALSGAVRVVSAGLTIRSCRFLGNNGSNGSAISLTSASLVAEDSEFLSNGVSNCAYGGAVYATSGASVRFQRCSFIGNRASIQGGALSIAGAGAVTLTLMDCSFSDNRTTSTSSANGGGALWVENCAALSVERCQFEGSSTRGPGAAIRAQNTPILLRSTAFQANTCDGGASPLGGAIALSNCSGTIESCSFTNNLVAGSCSGGSMYLSGSSPVVRECVFTGCRAAGTVNGPALGGSVGLANGAAPSFFDCAWSAPVADGAALNVCCGPYYWTAYGGALYAPAGCHPRLVRCAITGARARVSVSGSSPHWSDAWGGALWLGGSNAQIEDCVFTDCRAVDESTVGFHDSYGGAIYCENLARPVITRTRFVGSQARHGGAIYATGQSAPFILSCAFTGGSSAVDGGVLYSTSSIPVFAGCLFESNSSPTGSVVYSTGTGSNRPSIGTSVFCGNPGVDVVGPWYDEPGNTMLESCPGDCNGNGLNDAWEIASGQAGDCNANQTPDACEIAAGAADCDSDGVPDACEVVGNDANQDGIPDDCQQEFIGLVTEIVPLTDAGTGLPSGAVCWRVYAQLASPKTTVLGMFGDSIDTLSVTAAGGFWQSPLGGNLASEIQCSAATAGARYDSYLTIGAACADGTPLSQVGIDFSGFAAGNIGLLNQTDGGIVFVTAGGIAAGADRRVLLMQLTTNTGVKPTGRFNLVGEQSAAGGGFEWSAYGVTIPDAALVDCNGNGQHDTLEIAAGTATDCDLSGVPDSCESPAAATDCDSDGTSDFCELFAGARDSNNNGTPDDCECVADATGDGAVNVDDLIDVIVAWGDSMTGGADVDGSGVVDTGDLTLVLNNWGTCTPPAPPGEG